MWRAKVSAILKEEERLSDMTTLSTEAHAPASEAPYWYSRVLVREMWASLAISVMWLAVLFDAIFGPDFVSSSGGGTTRIPSAIIVALFAYLGTRVVARYGFSGSGDTDPERGHDRSRD